VTELSVVKSALTNNSGAVTPSGNHKLDTPTRRRHNLKLALELAAAGIFVFPTVDKNPVIEGWPKPDTECEQIKGEFRGCTRDAAKIRAMWRRWPDATPSISCGPSNLLVLDADVKKDGPAKLTQWLADNDIDISPYPVTNTRSGGLHVYLPNDQALGCSAGMFKDMGTDVKATGGQVVAPGAIREDGAAYIADENHPALVDFDPSLAEAPPAIIEAIKTAPKNQIGTDKTLESELIETLRGEDWPDGEDITDVAAGKYDLDILCAKDERLKVLLETGGNMSHSEARWHLASSLWAEYGDRFNVLDFAGIVDWLNNREGSPTEGAFGVFVADDKPGEGEFSFRSLARDFYRSENEWRVTDGSAFTAVEAENDNYDDGELPPEQQALKEKRKRTLIAESFDEAVSSAFAEDCEPLIDGWLDRGAMSVLYGDSNIGKSFVALHMGLCVATGREWAGRRVTQGFVVYIAAEGGRRFKRRMAAAAKHLGIKRGEAQFALVRSAVDLRESKRDANAIVDLVRREEAKRGLPCVMIIIDTLSRAMAGGDENSSIDMGSLVENIGLIQEKTDAHLTIIHHTGKDAARGARGHSLLRAATDSEIEVTPGKIAVKKQRDMDFADDVKFKLVDVQLEDANGNPAHSACVQIVEGGLAMPAVDESEEAATLQSPKTVDEELRDVVEDMGDSFSTKEAVDEWNRRQGRRGERVSLDTIDRRLAALAEEGLIWRDLSQGRKKARWRRVDDGPREPLTERARVELLAQVAQSDCAALGDTFRRGALSDAATAAIHAAGGRPMSGRAFEAALAIAQREGRIKVAKPDRNKDLIEYRAA
jgi:hypothetical protein